MTTLTTIIEEEKNEARRQVADTGTVDVDALLNTAMQRAYEAGREEVVKAVHDRLIALSWEEGNETNDAIRIISEVRKALQDKE